MSAKLKPATRTKTRFGERVGPMRSQGRSAMAEAPKDRPGSQGTAQRRRASTDRRLLAGRQLSVRRPDLPARQPAAAPAAGGRGRQAAAARSLGHHAGPQPDLRPHEPRDQGPRPQHASTSSAPATAARASSPTRTSRAATPSSTRASLATRTASASSSASSPSRAASPATSRPRPPARSTRAASSATRSPTPTAPRSTTRTCWCAASSATARPRPGRWRPAGIRTSSSTRRATARSCRSCISTATRSPTPPSWPASPSRSCAT